MARVWQDPCSWGDGVWVVAAGAVIGEGEGDVVAFGGRRGLGTRASSKRLDGASPVVPF